MRELKLAEVELVSGGYLNPGFYPLGTAHILDKDGNMIGMSPDFGGQPQIGSVPTVTNVFELNNGGHTSVTGEDANRDGVVDGYEELANSQDDIFESGSLFDGLGDLLVGDGPYSPPDEEDYTTE